MGPAGKWLRDSGIGPADVDQAIRVTTNGESYTVVQLRTLVGKDVAVPRLADASAAAARATPLMHWTPITNG